jgi:hypothetical protein
MLIRCDVNRDVGSQSLRNKRSNRRKSDGAIIIAGANLVVDGGYKSLTRGEQSVRRFRLHSGFSILSRYATTKDKAEGIA